MPETVDCLVDGGKATGGPPLGPALGPLGVNINEVVKAINEKTKSFAGMKVPVKVIIDPGKKTFEITVGTPPTSALITKELKLEKGGKVHLETVGNLTMAQAIKIAKMKQDTLSGKTLKDQVMEVIGTCQSMAVTVEGKNPKDLQIEIKEGKYDDKFK
jgi:large subunit ribosomal protein L11